MRRFPQIRNLRSRWSTRIMRQVDFCWTSGCVKKKWIDAKEASNQFQLFFHRAGIPSLRQVLSMKSWKMDDQEKWPPNFWVPPLTRRKLLQPPPLGNARPPPLSLFFSQADSHTRMHHTLARLTLSFFLAHKHLHIHTQAFTHTCSHTSTAHTLKQANTHHLSLSFSCSHTHTHASHLCLKNLYLPLTDAFSPSPSVWRSYLTHILRSWQRTTNVKG